MNLKLYKLLIDTLRDSLKAGLTFYMALNNLANMSALPPRLRVQLKSASNKIAQGTDIEEALFSSLPDLPIMLKLLLKAGLTSGRLIELLEQESQEVEKMLKMRTTFLVSMIYPSLLFILLACAINVFYYLTGFLVGTLRCAHLNPASSMAILVKLVSLPPIVPLAVGLLIIIGWFTVLWTISQGITSLRFSMTWPFRDLSIGRLLKTLGLALEAGMNLEYSLMILKKAYPKMLTGINDLNDIVRLLGNKPEVANILTARDIGTLDKALKLAGENLIEKGFNAIKATITALSIIISICAILTVGGFIVFLYVSIIGGIYNLNF